MVAPVPLMPVVSAFVSAVNLQLSAFLDFEDLSVYSRVGGGSVFNQKVGQFGVGIIGAPDYFLLFFAV